MAYRRMGVSAYRRLKRDARRLEGSRFRPYPTISRYPFRSEEGEIGFQTGGSRELPHAMFCPSFGSGDYSSAGRAKNPDTRRNVPGSRPFNEIRGHATRREKYRGVFLERSKAAPLQAAIPPRPITG
jgi:hypothetical protein